MDQTERYYSIAEVASMLRVAYLTVYRWIKAGKLGALRAGKQHRINQTSLNKFLNNKNKFKLNNPT